MSTIRIKSGSTTPTTSNVVDSELAFDRATGKVYIGSGSAGGAATSVVEVGGSVTSVGLTSSESFINVTSSSVTTSGNLSFEFNTQTANTVLAGPTTGADNNPTFRALVSDDLPDIDGGTF